MVSSFTNSIADLVQQVLRGVVGLTQNLTSPLSGDF
jgi:hypothetical protein